MFHTIVFESTNGVEYQRVDYVSGMPIPRRKDRVEVDHYLYMVEKVTFNYDHKRIIIQVIRF